MPLQNGTVLGHYEIIAPVGAGGMGEVYKARDPRLNRTVAIKILPADIAETERRQRFEREAQAIASLNHPHICIVHDVGHESGVDFLVMEYLEGETLADRLTKAGSILGTLQYMSPEQIDGRDADARSDIFAFGAMLYEMATGKRAFAGKSQVSLVAAILEQDPPPVSASQTLAPPMFDDVVRICLAKDPDERWQTAADLVHELKLVARHATVAAPVVSRGIAWRHYAIWSASIVVA